MKIKVPFCSWHIVAVSSSHRLLPFYWWVSSQKSIEKSFEALIRGYNGRRSGLRLYFRGLSAKHTKNTRPEHPIAKFVQTKDFPDTKDTRHYFVYRKDWRIFHPITAPLDATKATNATRKKRNEEIIQLARHNSYLNWHGMNQFCKYRANICMLWKILDKQHAQVINLNIS